MFDEMIIQRLIAEGYTREMPGGEVASVIVGSLSAGASTTGREGRDGVFRLDDFDRGRHAARALFELVAVDIDVDGEELPESIDVRQLDNDGWKQLMAAIAADTFEGSTLDELRELGMVDGDPVEVHFGDDQLERLRESMRAEGWRVAPGTRRGFEKWTPTGCNPLGGEGVVIRDYGGVYWIAQDDETYVGPREGSKGPEDIRLSGSTFAHGFKIGD